MWRGCSSSSFQTAPRGRGERSTCQKSGLSSLNSVWRARFSRLFAGLAQLFGGTKGGTHYPIKLVRFACASDMRALMSLMTLDGSQLQVISWGPHLLGLGIQIHVQAFQPIVGGVLTNKYN